MLPEEWISLNKNEYSVLIDENANSIFNKDIVIMNIIYHLYYIGILEDISLFIIILETR